MRLAQINGVELHAAADHGLAFARLWPLSVDRKTIAAYVRAARATGVECGGFVPTDEQISTIAATRRPGRSTNVTAPSPELGILRPHEPTIRQWLAEGPRPTKVRPVRALSSTGPQCYCVDSSVDMRKS